MAATFSAALLAGGQSRRMGRDKALLPVAGHSFLWQRQLALFEELAPRRIFWSGHAREGLPSTVTIVPDAVNDAGPLAGIAACLDLLEDDLLVVLAVDLSRMNAPFLQRLLLGSSPEFGMVPRWNGRFEPLAAAYPKSMLHPAQEHLAAGRLALQDFALAGIQAGLLQPFNVEVKDGPLFHNLNRPDDLKTGKQT